MIHARHGWWFPEKPAPEHGCFESNINVVLTDDLPRDEIMSKMIVTIQKYGNNSTASIPLALDDSLRDGKLKKGDLIIFVGFGAGLTYGANLVRL